MRMRAFLLIAILIGGTYMMLQSGNEDKEKDLFELLDSQITFDTLIFNKPPIFGTDAKTWIIEDDEEIQSLLHFLEQYRFRQLSPKEIDSHGVTEQFTIILQSDSGHSISVIVTEDLIIQNSVLYYEIVDGPLNVDWLVNFFVSNQN
ncbi:hypothetical protein [Sporosarcina sp. G11-34]|uniref:hypothetical protein n=1 Tax=Sporosarcina sp. G11-34 TaxID=2849605 RepID=UPI0022A976D0|nr:hypothetical protein [Sporosarcina sp. G11-34]MCZ2259622.1 hypothetical protein [Sporosarcina sp. G11-34]